MLRTARKTNNEQMAELSDLLLIMMVEWNRKIAVGLLADNVFLTIEDKLGMIFEEEESTEIESESDTDEYKQI